MGSQQFGREAKLTVAPIAGGAGIVVTDLRIAFDSQATSTSEPNKATVSIYNLNSASRGLIETEGQGVVLEAGYKGNTWREVVGKVGRVEHVPAGGIDIITKIQVEDGKTDLYGATFSRSYASGTSKAQILRDVLASMTDIEIGALTASGLSGNISGPLALAGRARVVADRLARAWGFEWSIQGGVAHALDSTGTRVSTVLAVKLSPSSGLLDAPTKTDRGCSFSALLSPAFPGDPVILESETLSGNFKIESRAARGDTGATGPGSWGINCEAVKL
jgi:hypothetical protein